MVDDSDREVAADISRTGHAPDAASGTGDDDDDDDELDWRPPLGAAISFAAAALVSIGVYTGCSGRCWTQKSAELSVGFGESRCLASLCPGCTCSFSVITIAPVRSKRPSVSPFGSTQPWYWSHGALGCKQTSAVLTRPWSAMKGRPGRKRLLSAYERRRA
jgi:hypothetical protein